MRKDLFGKGMVFGIIFLFVGAGVVPNISANLMKEDMNIKDQKVADSNQGLHIITLKPGWKYHDDGHSDTGGGEGDSYSTFNSGDCNGWCQFLGSGDETASGWFEHSLDWTCPAENVDNAMIKIFYGMRWSVNFQSGGAKVWFTFFVDDKKDEYVRFDHEGIWPNSEHTEQAIMDVSGLTLRKGQTYNIGMKSQIKSWADCLICIEAFSWASIFHGLGTTDDTEIIIVWENRAPYKPSKPSGSSSGEPGDTLSFTTSTTDPDADEIYYEWDFDAGNEGWDGPYVSGEQIDKSHSWKYEGDYDVKVRARDSSWKIGEWSEVKNVDIEYEDTCLAEGTKITMTDGSYKNIEDMSVGDRVLSYDIEHDKFTSWVVKATGAPVHHVYGLNDGLMELTGDHPIYIMKSDDRTGPGAIEAKRTKVRLKQEIMAVEVGDYVYTLEGELVEITSITPVSEPVQTYNILSLSGRRTFFANDILVYEDNPRLSIWIDYYLDKFFKRFPNAFPFIREILG